MFLLGQSLKNREEKVALVSRKGRSREYNGRLIETCQNNMTRENLHCDTTFNWHFPGDAQPCLLPICMKRIKLHLKGGC